MFFVTIPKYIKPSSTLMADYPRGYEYRKRMKEKRREEKLEADQRQKWLAEGRRRGFVVDEHEHDGEWEEVCGCGCDDQFRGCVEALICRECGKVLDTH